MAKMNLLSYHDECKRQHDPTFKIYTKAEESFTFTVRNNAVVLAQANPHNELQHWFKDFRWGSLVKDQDGFPAFALVNKANGLAIKHSIGLTHPVRLVLFNPDVLDESILWTESSDVGEGFSCIRMANNIKYMLDARDGIKEFGGVKDGTEIILSEWNKGDNQRWKIVPYYFFRAETSHNCCSLRFLLDGIKTVAQNPLTESSYYIWSCQLIKLFKANGYSHFLTKSESNPSQQIPTNDGMTIENPSYLAWEMVDQNIAVALCSTISESILSHVVSLETTADIWGSLSRKFHVINRSRVIELKNQLHHLKIEDNSMKDYIKEVKHIVDLLASAGAKIDNDDIILYTLNGLSFAYQPFQASILSKTKPIDLDEFYDLLASEEIRLANAEDFTTVKLITNKSTNLGSRYKNSV